MGVGICLARHPALLSNAPENHQTTTTNESECPVMRDTAKIIGAYGECFETIMRTPDPYVREMKLRSYINSPRSPKMIRRAKRALEKHLAEHHGK